MDDDASDVTYEDGEERGGEERELLGEEKIH